jgi:proteasome-associated ATPase
VTAQLPVHVDDVAAHHGDVRLAQQNMIMRAVEFMYARTDLNRFVEVTYESGFKEDIFFSHFISGATIRNVVDRAKLLAVLRFVQDVQKGIRVQDFLQATMDEMRSVEDLASTTNPDDWSRISGARGERITFVRTVRGADGRSGRALEVMRGNYG